jgi:hypothetical protein
VVEVSFEIFGSTIVDIELFVNILI